MDWTIGDRVTHAAKPEWGLGEIVDLLTDGKIAVRFVQGGRRLLKGAPLVRVTGPDATRPIFPKSGRHVRRPIAHRSFQEYRQVFVERFPKGFRDPKYVHEERDYKMAARELLTKSLSKKPFQTLLSEGNAAEACKRALAVVNATNLIFPYEKIKLRAAIQTHETQRRFAAGLFDLLHRPEPFEERFGKFATLLEALGPTYWTVATYFPFLWDPEQYMFLKPMATRRIAEACEVELNYRSELNWLTMDSLRTLTDRLFQDLADLGARDMIDLQSFIWKVARLSV